jgi:DNA-binding MarR family transcriptional regulator
MTSAAMKPTAAGEREGRRAQAGTRPPPALDEGGLRHLLGYRLALAEAASRRVFQRHIGGPFALRPVEFTILLLLLGNSSVSPKQLARTLGLSPPNVTVLIDRLARRKLLRRQRSVSDGRAMDLLLTAEGNTLAQRARQASMAMEAGLLAPLSPAERAMLGELLAKLDDAPAG